MIIHEAVVAKVFDHIQVSFTIVFIICALSFLTNVQTDIFSSKFYQSKADSSTATLLFVNHQL